MLRITRIAGYRVRIPLIKPYRLSQVVGTIKDAVSIVVRIETEDGLTGFGEADPIPFFTEETPETVEAVLANRLGPPLLESPVGEIARVHRLMDQVVKGHVLAKGAVDMAVHDLCGKALGIPVHRLLGGALTERIPLLWPIGSGAPEENADEIARKMRDGFRTFMIKTGALPLAEDVARVRKARAVAGDGIELIPDANQAWNVRSAVSFARSVQDLGIAFIEQPLPDWNRRGLAEVRMQSPVAISADESLVTLHDAANLILDRAADVFSLKVSKNGGLWPARKIAFVAEAMGIPCLINSMIELGITQAAALHLGASLPNLYPCGHCYMSTLRLSDDITNFGRLVTAGLATVPGEPGLGIEVDEQKLKEYTVSRFELTS